ncbi:type II toxin-antitoxin system PemK/MazF family toxin [Rhodoplanes serenus]|uniref:type II toxin-antitoxin system PemK/MazF family toxin n=1 Tax=Rhodoplanes serenus TaxID=200615 RepID=UPI0012D82F28|nr:type II toxin-antitoxin system PemK/MazF family toxin [Rhodoplanes serenus]
MDVKRGDVVLIVAQGDLGKPRPAVVVQSDDLGDETTTVLVCPMSSDVRDSPRLRPVIEATVANGLRVTSQIMTDKVAPVRRDRIRRALGALDPAAIERLDRALMVVLGLAG